MHTVTYEVEGMCCGGCATSVQTALNKIDGIDSAVADLEKNIVTIQYEASEPTIDTLKGAVANAGYRLVV